jgi:hypothetical protein
MKRYGLPLMQRQNQRGMNIMDAVMGMMIAAFLASALTTGLTSWFNTRSLASNQDSATQYAQGIVAKAKVGSWSSYGFPGASTTVPANVSDPKYAFCATAAYSGPGGFRANVNGEKTVISDTQPAGISPVEVVVLRGQPFCVRTDITWSTPPAIGAADAKAHQAYGVKHITMKLSWKERGKPKSITVDSTRSPNIGEAVPSSINVNDQTVLTPAVSDQNFNITAARYNAVSFGATWKNAVKAELISSNAETFTNPTTLYTVPDPATNVLNWTKDYGTTIPTNAYYRLILTDSIGLVTPMDRYQFPGSKLTINQSTKLLSWNAYGGLGTPSYNIMMDDNAAFSSPSKLATVTTNSYTAPIFTGDRWFRIDTVNSKYDLPTPAMSNVAQLTRPLIQPILTCAPNSYSMDMNFEWQNYAANWGSDVTATIKVQNNTSATVVTNNADVTGDSSFLQNIADTAATGSYTATMTVASSTGATLSGNVTCALPKFAPTVTYSPANQQMVVTSNLTYKELGFGIDSPTAYNGTTVTESVSVKGDDYFNPNKAYPSLNKSEVVTYSSAMANQKPSISQIIPITGGSYIPVMKIDLPTGTIKTRSQDAPSTRFPYRDYSQRPDGGHMLAGLMDDALTFWDFENGTFSSTGFSSRGVGWGSARNVALGQNTLDYTTSSVWLMWDTGFFRYEIANDQSGHTIGKTRMAPNGTDLFNNFIVVQNFFGDEKPAIIAIANQTKHGWNAGDMLAYKMTATGDLEQAVLVGWGWKNYTIAPVYDWNGYGTSGLFAFKGNDKSDVWMYNISPEGKSANGINIINSRTALANAASTPALWNYMYLASGGHDDSGHPVVLLTEGVAPFIIMPGQPADSVKYNSVMLDGKGGMKGYKASGYPVGRGFEAGNHMDRRWMQGNLASANNGNYCVDVPNSDFVNGRGLQLYQCNGTSAQEFKTNGYTTIMVRDAPTKCVDMPSNDVGRQLTIYDCHNGPNQIFNATRSPIAADLIGFKNPATGLCMDNNGGTVANNNKIHMWHCYGNHAQSWGFPWNDRY